MKYYITSTDINARCLYEETFEDNDMNPSLYETTTEVESSFHLMKNDIVLLNEYTDENGTTKHIVCINGERKDTTFGISNADSTCTLTDNALVEIATYSTELTEEQYQRLLEIKSEMQEKELLADNLDYAVELLNPSDGIHTDFKNIETVSEFLKLSYSSSPALDKVITMLDEFSANGRDRNDFITQARDTMNNISKEFTILSTKFEKLASQITIKEKESADMSYPQLNDYNGHGLGYLNGKYFEIAETGDAYTYPIAIYDIVADKIACDSCGDPLLFESEKEAIDYATNNDIRILTSMHETVGKLSAEEIKEIKDFDEYLSKSQIEPEDGHYILLDIAEEQEEQNKNNSKEAENAQKPKKSTNSKEDR